MQKASTETFREELDRILAGVQDYIKHIDTAPFKYETAIKQVLKETEKKKKDLANIEKAKTPNETKISELKTLITQQLNQIKQYSAQAQTLKTKLTENEEQLNNITKKCEAENKDLLKNKDLKEVFEKRKTDLLQSQKKELDELTEENERFKNDLEDKLKHRNAELHEKTQTMQRQTKENETMAEKLDDIEKHIGQQQQAYREEYENKKLEIAKHREKINEKLLKIEEDIAKLPELTDTKAKLADEHAGLKETEEVINKRNSDIKQRLDSCEGMYKRLNKYVSTVAASNQIKTRLKDYDIASSKLQDENERSKAALVTLMESNLEIRQKIARELETQKRLKLLMDDLEKKAATEKPSS